MTQVFYLKAPINGFCVPIDKVPDDVFAKKTLGSGCAIDPISNQLLAPAKGKIIQVHPCSHALTLRVENGIDILLHIGIDTVALKGHGFQAKVNVDDEVDCGQCLIEFDMDFVACHAKSLYTEIIILDSEELMFDIKYLFREKERTSTSDNIISLSCQKKIVSKKIVSEIKKEISTTFFSSAVFVSDPTGIHARPASLIASKAKEFQSNIVLKKNEIEANAKNILSILKLELSFNDKINIEAKGIDAKEAVHAISEMIGKSSSLVSLINDPVPITNLRTEDKFKNIEINTLIKGKVISSGCAVGNIYVIDQNTLPLVEKGENSETEKIKFKNAIQKSIKKIDETIKDLSENIDKNQFDIFTAHKEILLDSELEQKTLFYIEKEYSAAFSWNKVVTEEITAIANLKNKFIAARASDLRDVGNRVLSFLTGSGSSMWEQIPEGCILISSYFNPSDVPFISQKNIRGLCCTENVNTTSHLSILTKSLGIPFLSDCSPWLLSIPQGTTAILDASSEQIEINPSQDELNHFISVQNKEKEKKEFDLIHCKKNALTKDEIRILICANINSQEEISSIKKYGADGIGLLRSEFLFLNKTMSPTENEQTAIYSQFIKSISSEQHAIIRTLDVGGDKPLPYIKQEHEDNPFLGERGLRLCLNYPELFRIQLRSILKASLYGNCHIMFPMVSTLAELQEAKKILEEERKQLGIPPIKIGIMIEVPAAALMADIFAQEVDFFSIGSNDLTQYVLAADRTHKKLGYLSDGLHPAVLKCIEYTASAAIKANIPVGVCGGIAGDYDAIPILLGFGITELSVSLPAVPSVKSLVRSLNYSECSQLAQKSLDLNDASEVRACVRKFMENTNE